MRTGLLYGVPFHRFVDAAGRSAPRARPWSFRGGRGLTALIGLLVLCGCQHPLAERRVAAHQRSLAWTAGTLVEREQAAPQHLARSATFIQEDVAWHREAFGRDVRWLGARLGHDLHRWQARQPARGHKLGEILAGKPANLERVAIILSH